MEPKDLMGAAAADLRIRPFKSDDYEAVFDLAKESKLDPWAWAYWRTLNGSKMGPLSARAGALSLSWMLSEDVAWRVVAVLFAEVLIVALLYVKEFFVPAWSALLDNMVDYSLKAWTTAPGFLLVAAEAGEEEEKHKKKKRSGEKEDEKKKKRSVVAMVAVREESGRRRTARLEYLSVNDAYKGYGLGTHLCQTALEKLSKDGRFDSVLCTVPDSAQEAQKIFTKLGFKPAEEEKKDGSSFSWKRALDRLARCLHGVERKTLTKDLNF